MEAEEETLCVIQDVYLNENHEGTESLRSFIQRMLIWIH